MKTSAQIRVIASAVGVVMLVLNLFSPAPWIFALALIGITVGFALNALDLLDPYRTSQDSWRTRRISREYDRAGTVNRLLAPWGFLDDQTFITKAGSLGLVYRVTGIDYEGLDDETRRRHVHRFEEALRLLDTSSRVYQYLLKRETAPLHGRPLYTMDLYLVLLVDVPKRRSWRDVVTSSLTLRLLSETIDTARAQLDHTARAFETSLDAVGLTRLGKAEAFRFFRRLVNDTDTDVRLKYDTHVDYFMADTPIECHRDHLLLGSTRVQVLTMKEAPASTFALMLEDLYALPGTFTACLEWHRLPMDRMKREIHARRRHFWNKRISMVNYLGGGDKAAESEMLVDDSAGAVVAQLGKALTELEIDGHFFGEASLTIAAAGPEADRTAAAAAKILATHDGSFIAETFGLLHAWVAMVPGNVAYNMRRLALLETHLADLSFLFTVNQGAAHDLAGRAPLTVLATQQHTPFRYHLHVQDVGHTLVLGATGSGKTFLLNTLVDQAQQYTPRTVIFDLGHGYRDLARRLGGRHLEFGLETGVAVNPFATDPTPEALHFLTSFCQVLMEGTDGYHLSLEQSRELHKVITHLYHLPDPAMHRLGTVSDMLPRPLDRRLANWVEGGRYGRLFDHATDTLSLSDFQVFEFEAIRDYPELLEPLLFAILHRVSAGLTPQTLTLCVMDEAWRFIQHPTLRAYVVTALKTWRKKNAAVVLATQAIEDFASVDLLRTVVESCPTALLLANPALDRTTYATLFKLNPVELALLVNLRPRGQVLLKRDALAKVLDVIVDPHPQKELAYA